MQNYNIPKSALLTQPLGRLNPRPGRHILPRPGRASEMTTNKHQLVSNNSLSGLCPDSHNVAVSGQTRLIRGLQSCYRCDTAVISYSHNCRLSRVTPAAKPTMAGGRDKEEDSLSEGEVVDRRTDSDDSEVEAKDEASASEDDEAVEAFLAKHRRIDEKEVTLHLRSSILNLYFNTLIGEGRWDKEARQHLNKKYFLSDTQYDRIHGWDMSGLSTTLQQIHGGARNVAKILLKLYESQGSAELAMSGFNPIALYEEDGERAREFTLPSVDSLKLEIEDEEVEKLVAENDPKVVARSYIAHKKMADLAKKAIGDSFEALESAQSLAAVAQSQHTVNSGLTWDCLQLLAQHDLQIKSSRESQYSKFPTKDFSQSLSTKNRDRVTRKERDKNDVFFSDRLDKVVAEEAESNKVG